MRSMTSVSVSTVLVNCESQGCIELEAEQNSLFQAPGGQEVAPGSEKN